MTTDRFPAGPAMRDLSASFSRRTFLRSGGLFLALQAARPRSGRLFGSQPTPPAIVPQVCLAGLRAAYPPPLERFIAKLDPASDDFPTEQYAEEITRILTEWSVSLCRSLHDPKTILGENLSAGITASSLQPSETIALRTTGPLR